MSFWPQRALVIACLLLYGCDTPQPLVLHGDANSVELTQVGDAAAALAVARRHCSQFEKVPRLIDAHGDEVLFDCVRR